DDFRQITPELQENILAFYRDPAAVSTKKDPDAWKKTLGELQKLRSVSPSKTASIELADRP
ncbi:MAG TPA: hypothetical protein VMP68_30290, partial [Candidatus Eisenbacteria bacterium]|nr:hypothetical protein [Candidatus Eisenbacteria bacterium]